MDISESKAQKRIAQLERYAAQCQRTEIALMHQSDFVRRIFDSTDACMAVIGDGGRIVDVNATWRRFALQNGAGDDESSWGVGANYFQELTEPGDRTNALEAFEGIRKVQKCVLPHFEIEYPCHSPETQRWFILRAVPLTGQPGTVLVSHSNVTKLKLAEEELIEYRNYLETLVKDRTMELEEKNKKLGEEITEKERLEVEKQKVEAQLMQSQKIEAMGSFAGGIAHDINNILSPIVINIELLLDDAEPGTKHYEMLKQTLDSAYRQRDLVKQILSFSRQGAQKMSPISMTPLLENTLNFARSTLPSTIDIRHSIDAPLDTVMGDSTQMQQVIMNLLRNAADALVSQEGIIEVSLADVHMDGGPVCPGEKPGEYLELTVRDTGQGMPPEVIDRVFDPFFTTKSIGKGTGLGLSVVHGIVKNHGGTIAAESKEGEGSRFTVLLPLYDG
jgi:signal transduction histidine kinase